MTLEQKKKYKIWTIWSTTYIETIRY